MPPEPRRTPDLIAATTKEGKQVPVQVGLDPSKRRIAIRVGSEIAYLTPQQASLLRQALANRQAEVLWHSKW